MSMTSESYTATHPNILPLLEVEEKVQDQASKEKKRLEDQWRQEEADANAHEGQIQAEGSSSPTASHAESSAVF